MSERKIYTEEFKREAVRLAIERGNLVATARELDLCATGPPPFLRGKPKLRESQIYVQVVNERLFSPLNMCTPSQASLIMKSKGGNPLSLAKLPFNFHRVGLP